MITISRATDAAALHELAAATFALACPPDTTQLAIESFIAEHLSTARFAEYLADDARDVLVASIDGEPAGYTMLVDRPPTDPDVIAAITSEASSELSKFYVLPGHHGSGLASSLMEATLEVARQRGSVTAWLGVNIHNARANRFYEKHGFEKVGVKRFLVGERWEDDFVRERRLATR